MQLTKRLHKILYTAFCKSYWKSDFMMCCVSTLPLNLLLSGDSVKGLSTNKIIFSLTATLFSYAIIYVFLTKTQFEKKIYSSRCYQWLYVSVLGSIVYSFSMIVLGSLIWNLQYKKERTILEYVHDLFPNMATGFVLFAVCATLMTIIPVVIARMVFAILFHIKKG